MRLKRISLLAICLLLVGGAIGFGTTLFRDDGGSPEFSRGDEGSSEFSDVKNFALGRPVAASSNVARAHVLVDGQELPNASWHTSWSPPQTPSRPSWVTIDLGQTRSVQRLAITFSIAAYEGIYDVWAPPTAIVIELGDRPDKTELVETLAPEKIPNNGDCANKRRLEVRFKEAFRGRYVKLVFPTGGKLPSMPDVVGLAEIAVYGSAPPRRAHKGVAIEGHFGRAVVDVNSPQMIDLFLREPGGNLAERSLLAGPVRGVTLAEARSRKIFRRQGAYTYVSENAGPRFESYRSRSHKTKIETGPNGAVERIILTGIRPQSESETVGPAEETWTFEKTAKGELTWAITRRWIEPANLEISGTPALHLARFGGWGAHRDRRVDPADAQITGTAWYDPAHLISGSHPDYETYAMPAATEYRTHTIDVRDTWAIYKLFTNFHLQSDLRLAVKGGYLYRRAGVRNDFNEIGAITEPEHRFERRAGDVFTVTLVVSPVDKMATGQQLAVEIPDQVLMNQLRDLHASVLNGGVISDPKRYHFGNGTEDINYAGSSQFQARALSVSTRSGALAEHPYNADDAFKGHLERILATVDDRGLTHFGFNVDGALIDDNLHVISAANIYAVKTGDRAFIDRHYATLARMVDFFTARLDKSNGLFRSPGKGAHWYYDGISYSGFNAYYQAFLYQALVDVAEMAEIVGKANSAALRRQQAERLRNAINTFMWFPDAPGGPRYADWIDESGKRVGHFIDIAQYPIIAFGIAPPDRAEAMLATADRRLTELKERYGHSRSASLSLLWPLSPKRGERCFGTYFYGGSVLASTYWEVIARARAGHVDGEWGAYRLLQNFAKRFAETSFVGSNSIDIRGNISLGGDEGYLADMVVVPAALVHGLLGVKLNWWEIKVAPALPSAWKRAKTSVVWKGRLYDLRIRGDSVSISPR